MRAFQTKLGIAMFLAAAAICAALHVATFVTMLSPMWVLPAAALVAGGIACTRRAMRQNHFSLPVRNRTLFSYALLVYALATFVYFYKTTGGATSVGIVDGIHVSLYKNRIITNITEYEYRMFPNLWTRVLSAWISVMAAFGLISLVDADESG